MNTLSQIVTLLGLAITVFGIWAVSVCRDPLGYAPTNLFAIPFAGLIILAAGIIWSAS